VCQRKEVVRCIASRYQADEDPLSNYFATLPKCAWRFHYVNIAKAPQDFFVIFAEL